ncbi:helveticin J family class III bacteriocin [Lentilactobacillus raoultii]|uniref:Helveticin J family class III bacteriocin n=1 Tax=Lentilactobacillus raoultii TaxID=1987503 RepID=A0ABW3PLM1_9LACO|nr:helveticin J family class III bacteriocin [Lentilactobacillus raoultii]
MMTNAKRKFTLTMPGTQVVQKFYLDSDGTAYALQMYGEKDDMLLRYINVASDQKDIDFTKSGFSEMRLKNFGHCQTFEPFTDSGGDKWAWVATYASSKEIDSLGDHWASRIGVIKLDGKDKNASDVHAITYLNYLGTGTTKNMSLHRVDAALSSDKTRLAIWTQSRGDAKTAQKRITALNAKPLFDALQNGNINAKTDPRMIKGGSFYVSSRDISKYVYPQNSWQGMELSNKRSAVNGGYNWLYFTSGQAKKGSKPMIVRSPWNVLGSTPVERVISFSDLSGSVEIEAPQLTGNDILFGIESGPAGGKTHYIYSVSKSIF